MSAFAAQGAAAPAFVTDDRALSIGGSSTAQFITDDRHISFAGSSNVSPVAKGLFSSAFAGVAAAQASLSGMSIGSASYTILSPAEVTAHVTSFHHRLISIQGKAMFDPKGSQNKDMRFVIQSSANAAFVSDGLAPRQLDITGGSSVQFVSQRDECSLRMALPFDRIQPRTLRIKGLSVFKASTDIPGGMVFSIRGRTKLLFKPLETKVRCAKFLSRQHGKPAIFRGAYG